MKTYFLKIVFAFLFVLSPFVAFAGSEHNITGYAWSSNIGWISFNSTEAGSSSIVPGGPCTLDGITVPDGSSEVFYQEKLTEEDHDCVSNSRLCTNGVLGGNSSFQFSSCTAFDQPCVGAGCIPPNPTNPTIASNPNPSTSNQGVNYGVNKNSDGTLTGYAWSSNIGWIKFGGLSGFPTGDGTQAQNANINGNNLKGWAKALSADDNGWDGWISLSGSGYGISFSSATGYFSGYAWGGDVVGWISFNSNNTGSGGSLPYSVVVGNASTCSNDAINYPACNTCNTPSFVWNNASSSCVSTTCLNGAINSPTCDTCAASYTWNGISCVASVCTNSAINPPACDQCPTSFALYNSVCVPATCDNGAINPPSTGGNCDQFTATSGDCGATHYKCYGDTTTDTGLDRASRPSRWTWRCVGENSSSQCSEDKTPAYIEN